MRRTESVGPEPASNPAASCGVYGPPPARARGSVQTGSVQTGRLLLPQLLLAVLFLGLGCRPETVEAPFEPSASYGEYRSALERLGLQDTHLGRSWIEAGTTALQRPVSVSTPFEEAVLLDPQVPAALTYLFAARRGRVLIVSIETELDAYFADLFRIDADTLAALRRTTADAQPADPAPDSSIVPVASRPRGSREIRIEVRQDGYYLVRLQPELLRGGSVRVRIAEAASLAFPVQGGDPGDIMSFYGDPRDGGRRVHEGLDIFAARGTPVVAADDAMVASVRNRGLGGKTITLRLARSGVTLYYAHLDEQLVSSGQSVLRGEVIGKVGNTGNAATTPPHLHLGIYEGSWRQDVDPWDYLVDPPRLRRPPTPHEELLGSWRRAARPTELRIVLPSAAVAPEWRNRAPSLRQSGAGDSRPASPEDRSSSTADPWGDILDALGEPPSLEAGTPVRIVGSAAELVRVRTAGGLEGYVEASVLEEVRDPWVPPGRVTVHDPASGDVFGELDPSSRVGLLGSEAGRTYVVLPSGRVGFVRS